MFILNSKDLNDKQINAIQDENSVVLIACPGSGKTRTLTYKIAFELDKLNSLKEYIVAITYTNRAADEIKDRIELLGVDTKQLWIGTIHSFCLEWILKPYSQYLQQLKYGFRVINSHDSEEIITTLCNQYNSSNRLNRSSGITYWDCGYIITENLQLVCTTSNSNKKPMAKIIIKEYFEILLQNKQIDFELILYFALKLLKDKTKINDILANIFPYIIIDEFQDTKGIQYHIVGSILKASQKKTKLFMVGDPNQSIFQSLGGYPIDRTAMEELTNLEIREHQLIDNYRSSSKIITYFVEYKTFESYITSSGIHKDYDSVITFNELVRKDDLVDEIVRLIEFNINIKRISQNEICILAPWWIHLISLTRSLMVKLPEYSFDGPGLAPFARDIDNFWYKLSKIILTEPSPGLYIRRLRWAKEILNDLEQIGVDVSGLTSKRLLKYCNSIFSDEVNGLDYLRTVFNELFIMLKINYTNYKTLSEHYNSFFESSQTRIDRLTNDGIDYAGEITTFKKVFKQKEGITVSTIHGAKGAEFDTVIAVGLLQGMVPHFNDINKVESAKKQLYVIASRARKNLHLIAERRNSNFGEYNTTNILSGYNYNYDPL